MLPNLEDALISQGAPVEPSYTCPSCGDEHPAFAMVTTEDGGWECSKCMIEQMREAEAASTPSPETLTWDSELGNTARVERNIFLDKWRWTILPDSPLTETCQNDFKELLRQVNRLSLDHDKPHDAREALNGFTIPAIVYAED